MTDMQGFAPVFAVALLIIGVFTIGVQSIGVCYGVIGNDLPSPSDVVQLYRSNGISNMRLFSADNQALNALRGSGISVILGIANENVGDLAASQSSAVSWVQTNVRPYYPDVNIKYIAVGNEITGGATQSILPAMRNLNGALAAAGLDSIKVSTALPSDVITNSFPPSKGEFKDPSVMVPIVQFLANTGAPYLANVYPYFAYKDNPQDIKLNYALFQPGTTARDDGNGLIYTNLFDAMLDAIYAALEKAAAPNVRIVVSESGWPSDGGFAASVENARIYNQNLIDHVGHGTPKRSSPIETYVFAMFNENQKTGEPSEKHFGLFYPNKSPVYPIAFGSKQAKNSRNYAGRYHMYGYLYFK